MLPEGPKVFLASQAIDMRKSYQGLSVLVEQVLSHNPFGGDLFVFYNKRRNRLKIIYWHINGFCIWQKRLEKGQFQLVFSASGQSIGVTSYQLQGLIQGIDWQNVPEPKTLFYRHF